MPKDELGLTQPNASRHLSVLRNAGVVEARREGTWTYYRLTQQPDSERQHQMEALVRALSTRGVLKRDVEQLLKVRGPGACR